jgi:hypothetical protein
MGYFLSERCQTGSTGKPVITGHTRGKNGHPAAFLRKTPDWIWFQPRARPGGISMMAADDHPE